MLQMLKQAVLQIPFLKLDNMKKYKNYCFILLLILSCTCKKKEPTIIETNINSNLPQLIWNKDLTQYNDGQDFFSFTPIIYKNLIIYSSSRTGNKNAKIYTLNKETGELVWQWTNEKSTFGAPFAPPYIYDNILIVPLITFELNQTQLIAIDLKIGKTIWHKFYTDGYELSSKIFGYKENVFTLINYVNEYKYDFVEINIYTGQNKLIKTITNNGIHFSTRDIKVYQTENKINIVFSVLNYLNSQFNQVKDYDLYNFDLIEKKFNYIKKIDYFNINDTYQEISHADSNGIWFSNGKRIICLDESSANIKWELPPPNPTGWYKYVKKYRNLIIVYDECYDYNNKEQLWQINRNGNGSSNYIFYNYKMYFTSLNDSRFHCYDLKNGQELFAMYAPARVAGSNKLGDNFIGDVLTIDTVNNRFYAATYKEALCFKFNP